MPVVSKLSLILIGFLLLQSCSTTDDKNAEIEAFYNPKPPVPAVGQVYTYKHAGPQPWSDGLNDATGKRIVAVMGNYPDNKHWKIEERYEAIEGNLIGEYDDAYRLYRQTLQAPGGELQIVYSEPVSIRYHSLKEGEQKVYHYSQTFFDKTGQTVGTAKVTDTTSRGAYNVRIITPAGAYLCRTFSSVIEIQTLIQGQTTTFTGTIKTYWCDTIGWFVKEEGTFNPVLVDGKPSQAGYKTESILESLE